MNSIYFSLMGHIKKKKSSGFISLGPRWRREDICLAYFISPHFLGNQSPVGVSSAANSVD